MGRRKSYNTAKELRAGIDAYIRSISYESRQHGVAVRVYVKTPTVAGLCLYLGISRSTWANYGADPKLGPVVEYAKLILEDYLAGQLDTKFANGAKFNLMANYGWREKVDVTGDGAVRVELAESVKGLAQ